MQTPENIVMRERVDFSKIKTTIPIPNLIEIQKKSYEKFLQMDLLPAERDDGAIADPDRGAQHQERPAHVVLGEVEADRLTWEAGLGATVEELEKPVFVQSVKSIRERLAPFGIAIPMFEHPKFAGLI